MAKYADGTSVSVDSSRSEVYRVLERYGTKERVVGENERQIAVSFELRGRLIRVGVPLPVLRQFPSKAGYDREIRRLWRVMILLLKGRLELVADGVETVDQAFMPYVLLPSGRTVGEEAIPMIANAYETGQVSSSVLPSLAAPKIIALGERTA